MSKDSTGIGDRMKDYESITQTRLPLRSWSIVRLDGRAFHTYTKDMARPFSNRLAHAMDQTAEYLCEEVAGVVMAYVQSDEISLVMHDLGKVGTQQWFGGNVQKITSVTASLATARFNWLMLTSTVQGMATFDSRVFTLPAEDVPNYLIWRQRDAVRNSISMAAQSRFDHEALHGKTSNEMQEMLFAEAQINWNDYPARFKRGGVVVKRSAVRPTSYIDKRDGVEHAAEVLRHWWEIQEAPHFDYVEALNLLALNDYVETSA